MTRLISAILLFVLIGSPAWGAITKVQSAAATSGSLALNGVTAGNLLVLTVSYFKTPQAGTGMATPTDSNGTFSTAFNSTPAAYGGTGDAGAAIFYIENAAAGTHTITISATDWYASLAEYSGIATSGALDRTSSGQTNSSTHTSRDTGTTAATTQNAELIVIASILVASTGAADVGWTDPVSGFTTVAKSTNDSTDVAGLHAFKTVSSTGTQTATFDWTRSEPTNTSQASIATFKAALTRRSQTPIIF